MDDKTPGTWFEVVGWVDVVLVIIEDKVLDKFENWKSEKKLRVESSCELTATRDDFRSLENEGTVLETGKVESETLRNGEENCEGNTRFRDLEVT